ncbi:MAG: (2Fe-2S)-binding protein [Firmicutes bacterium]|nr:(2Fe-2S)-binding protein [Bacillota bacterium]
MRKIALNVNDEEYSVEAKPHHSLLHVLREQLGLTGAKEGCGEGHCGACTVLLDGRPVNSCLLLAVEAEGARVTTIEGLAEGGRLHPIQEAFINQGAVQCGYCTPGMILSAKALLDEIPDPGEKEIREAISGNLCRCTGYVKIVEAIRAAGKALAATRGA